MKKCPYCKTLMNDDVKMCPNCLKDMSNLREMPEVNIVGKSKSTNMVVYGGILTLGGFIAALSQSINKGNYQKKYDDLVVQINNATSESAKNELIEEALEFMALINECKFREVLFYILAGAGIVLLIVTIVLKIKSLKKEGK